jgi:hypothetical protein
MIKFPAAAYLSFQHEEQTERQSLWRSRWPLLVLACVGAFVMLPVFIYGLPSGADMVNHYRFAFGFHDALSTGRLYPGWMADSNSGYGDPSVRFYPPALYYLMAAMRALTGDWYKASIITFLFLTIAGAYGAYFWARSFVPRRFALWAGVFYALAPFHVNEMLENFLVAEYAGGAALAFAFGFVERVCRKGRWQDVAGLSAAYALLILTHLPLAVMGSLALLLYALVRLERGKVCMTLHRLGVAVAFGVAASAFFWMTIITELKWIRAGAGAVDSTGYYDYHNNFLFASFSYGNGLWWSNYIAFATVAMFAPVLVLLVRRSSLRGVRAVGIVLAFSFLMTTVISKPLWAVIPKLSDVQFPWRWLAITSLAGAVLVAISLPRWTEKLRKGNAGGWRKLAIPVAGSVVLSFGFLATHFMDRGYYLSRQQFNEQTQSFSSARGHELWRPIWAGGPVPPAMEKPVAVEGRAVSVTSWEAERGTFRVAEGVPTEARVRAFYYPHWKATADGQPLATRAADDGALLITLPREAASVELEFHEPLRTGLTSILSLIGWLSIGGLFIFASRQGDKQWK